MNTDSVKCYDVRRREFINLATNKGARMVKFPIRDIFTLNPVYIDVAIFDGEKDSLLLHISGTHGIEGYAGSEIQFNILKDYEHDHNGPTVIMVHSLNPFGMKYWRRVNENNVDLNRNALFSENNWKNVLERDSNIAGYDDISDIINPVTFNNSLLFKIMLKLFTNGIKSVKRAMVTGTYHNKKGLFYGGNELEESHKFLRNLLVGNGYTKNVKKLTLIDVHTGLGSMGEDTLMLSTETKLTEINKHVFDRSYQVKSIHEGVESYDLTLGNVADNYPKLFHNLDKTFTVSLTQEFGTYDNIQVGIGLIKENQKWNSGNHDLDYNLYKLFFPYNEYFYENINVKGPLLFYKCLNFHKDRI